MDERLITKEARMTVRSALYVCSILALCGAGLVRAAEEPCTDRPECWPEGSAMRTRLLQAEKELQLDTTLQKKHAELVTLVRFWAELPW